MTPSRIAAVIVLATSFCACSGEGKETAVEWHGVWYETASPLTRGAFTAKLIVEKLKVTGTVTMENHALGTFEVTGTRTTEYSGAGQTYENVDLESRGGAATIGLLQYGGGLADDSLMYGTMTSAGASYSVYTMPENLSVPASGYRAQVFGLKRLTVDQSTGSVYTIARSGEDDPTPLFCTITGGTGESSCIPTFSSSTVMRANAGALWFAEGSSLVPYDGVGEANGSPIVTGAGTGVGNSIIDFTFAGNSVCTITGFVSDTVSFYDATSGAAQGTMPGSFADLEQVVWTGDRYLFLRGTRDGTLSMILAYDRAGTLLGQWRAPVDNVAAIDSDGTNLVIGNYTGWILHVPLIQFQ